MTCGSSGRCDREMSRVWPPAARWRCLERDRGSSCLDAGRRSTGVSSPWTGLDATMDGNGSGLLTIALKALRVECCCLNRFSSFQLLTRARSYDKKLSGNNSGFQFCHLKVQPSTWLTTD